jgi:DNA-binding transcriptional ArsR family regulator
VRQPIEEVAYDWDRRAQRFVPARRTERFLKGPVPMSWLAAAARLPGKALAVGIALWRLAGATKSQTILLSTTEVVPLGVDRNAKSRALRVLEQAGLVSVERRPGRLPRVTILTTKA